MKFDIKKIITKLFYIVAFLPPLVLYPYTSEIFEFNKMITVYTLTVLIIFFWLVRCVVNKRLIFTKSSMDLPIVLFLVSQGISTLLSIDTLTSIYGYPSRYHGGLLSLISYSLLYWAFVSNMDKKDAKKFLSILVVSSFFVGVYAVLQRFGIDDLLWEQDVKTRVFSTLGQPNWLAAWVVPVILICLARITKYRKSSLKLFYFYNFMFLLLTTTLLLTRSRSGIASIIISLFVFFAIMIYFEILKRVKNLKDELLEILIDLKFIVIGTLLAVLVIGTPWTKNLGDVLAPVEGISETVQVDANDITASEDIRKIVWRGAIDIWENYPVFGTGVETFAYSYYQFRPQEHNLVSEWDFLYNKAHNEYLNTLANTGSFGFIAYMIVTTTAILVSLKKVRSNKDSLLHLALATSIISITITNFFGFLVVPVALEFMLFPAISVALSKNTVKDSKQKISNAQTIGVSMLFVFALYLLNGIYNYWYADVLYGRGKSLNYYGNYADAQKVLTRAVNKNSKQPFYFAELAHATAGVSLSLEESSDHDEAVEFAKISESQAARATIINPSNPNMYRVYAGLMTGLSAVDPTYLTKSQDAYNISMKLAPTDAKIRYRLGLTQSRLGNNTEAIETLKESIELKPDYVDARYALAQIYTQENLNELAIEQLNYILDNLSPDNTAVKSLLESINSSSL